MLCTIIGWSKDLNNYAIQKAGWSGRTFNHQKLVPTFPWIEKCLMVTKQDFLENGIVTIIK